MTGSTLQHFALESRLDSPMPIKEAAVAHSTLWGTQD